MKKNFFRSLSMLAAIVCGNFVFTSCADETLLSEEFIAERAKAVVTLDEHIETAIVDEEGEGAVRRWTLSDGQTVIASHTGNIDVDNIEIVNINEVPSEDGNTTQVNILVASKSRANTITRSVSYAKMVKATPDTVVVVKTDTVVVEPTPEEPVVPTITKEYFVADTTMTYKNYASGMVKITMNHILTKVSEWSDGHEDRSEIWNKSFMVAKTVLTDTKGRLYSCTAAKDLGYHAGVSVESTEESTEEGAKLTKKNGQFDFYAEYICDAEYPQTWDAHVIAEVTYVDFSYEGYSASYTFDFAVDFINQKEENRSVENEVRGGHEYVYESTSVATWNISMNGVKLGTMTNELEIFHF